MWKQICLLTGVQFRNFWGWNQIIYGKDKKKKNGLIVLATSFIFLAVMFAFYSGMISYGYITIGLGRLVPAIILVMVSMVILFFSIFKAGSIIFDMKTYDMMISLPVSPTAIIISRFLNMYIQNLTFSLILMLPSAGVYAFFLQPGITYYITMLLGSLLIPLLPMTLATGFGALVAAISSRMKHKNLVTIILTLGLTIAIIAGSLMLPTAGAQMDITEEWIQNISIMAEKQLYSAYPPARLFTEAVVDGNWISFIAFIGLSIGIFSVLVALIQWKFVKICSALYATAAGKQYKMQELSQKSAQLALYKKELGRYFSSSIYVLNTLVGYLMMVFLAVGVLIAGKETMESLLEMPGIITKTLPLLLVFMVGLSSTTNCAVSIEGKQWWVTKSLPVSASQIFNGKIMVNLTVALPCYLLTEILVFIAIKPRFLEALWLLVIPLVYILFASVLGITINCKLPMLDWESETVAVKQGTSLLVALLVNFIVALVPTILVFMVNTIYSHLIYGLTAIVISVVTYILYKKNQEIDLRTIV